jgi:uncharacterized protein YukE
MANRIAVRSDDLDQFATQVERVRDELADTVGDVGASASGLQSSIVLDALRDFGDAWSDRRRELLDQMQDAAGVLRNAAAQFEAVDDQLASGLQSSGGAE